MLSFCGFDILDLSAESRIFFIAAISKPAWMGRWEVDDSGSLKGVEIPDGGSDPVSICPFPLECVVLEGELGKDALGVRESIRGGRSSSSIESFFVRISSENGTDGGRNVVCVA